MAHIRQINIKPQLKGLTLAGLQKLFLKNGEAKYRAQQVFNWMYNYKVISFDVMENLPKSLRSKLADEYSLVTLEKVNEAASKTSGTKKLLFRTAAGHVIESVIIPEEDRATLCISTQVGCPLDCKFCATGLMGYKMNLTPGEIFDQYMLSQEGFEKPITNIVYMGMGEPLLNYESTLNSLEIFSQEMTRGLA